MEVRKVAWLLAVMMCGMFLVAGVASAATVQEIKDRGVLKVAVVDFEMEPFVFTKDGQLAGLDIELTTAVANQLGVKIEFVRVPWDKGITLAWDPSYKWDQFDMAASSITIKDSRAEICDFSEWYVTSGQMILVRADSGFKTNDDLKDKKIAYLAGSVVEPVLKEVFPNAQLLPLKGTDEIYVAVRDKTADAGANDGAPTLLMAKRDNTFYVFEEPLTKERYGVAMPKGTDLKAVVDEIVKAQRKDLYNKWLK